MIISKDRNSTSNVTNWRTYHQAIGNTKYLTLNSSDAAFTFDDWGNTTPTSSVYTIGGSGGYRPTNTNNTTYVAYVFADVQGYSKFGSYVGNGSNSGPYIHLGFKPAFIMTKKSDGTSGWFMQDIKRGIKNQDTNTPVLQANGTFSEATVGFTDYEIDFLSNGFKLRDNNTYVNASGSTYIYMAFAENPFVTSTGIPTTAR